MIYALCIEYEIESGQEISHFYQLVETASAEEAKKWVENSLFKTLVFSQIIQDNIDYMESFNGVSLRDRNGGLECAWTIEDLKDIYK